MLTCFYNLPTDISQQQTSFCFFFFFAFFPLAGCREGIFPPGSFPPLAFRRHGTASPLLSVLRQRGVIPGAAHVLCRREAWVTGALANSAESIDQVWHLDHVLL